MSLTSLTFFPSLRRPAQHAPLDYELLDAADALAKDGRVLEAVSNVFEHLFPGAPKDLATTPFSFVQGSSRVTARIEGDELAVSVPVVQLPVGGRSVAALRYVVSNLGGSGQLHQPRLRGDELHFEYRDRLARMSPAKLLEVLRQMPFAADRNDDWLIDQFGATPLDRAEIEPLDEAELDRAEAFWRAHWDAIEALNAESQRRRSVFLLNELTAYTLHGIRFTLPLCGVLTSRIHEAGATFDNTQEDPNKREAALTRLINEMKAVTRAQLASSLGHATYALSPLAQGTAAVLANDLGPGKYPDTVDKLLAAGRSLEAAVAMIGSYMFLLARCSWPAPIASELVAGLTLASGKPWREAAGLLQSHARDRLAVFTGGAPEDTPTPAPITEGVQS